VLPPETRPHKIDLSGRKSWCESDDPAFAAKAADIVRLYTGGPALHKKPAIVLDRHCLGFDQTVGFLQALGERNGDVPGAIRGLAGKPPATVALRQKTRRIPIVFVGVTDPAATSIVERLDRPSGNVIGPTKRIRPGR
jgi:hypothetical protein